MTMTMPAGVQVARDLVGPSIAAAVGRLNPSVRAVAAYHLGLADATGKPVTAGAGKALRPALALLSARAAGAPAERAVSAAAAVELVHNFSLLHDDIMDGDTERRHRPTAWTVFGVGPAILAGDALLVLAQDLLLETPPYGVWAARCLSAAVQRLIAGQSADLDFERRDDVQVSECLDMAGRQDGGADGVRVQHRRHLHRRPGGARAQPRGVRHQAGLAFQLADDMLGIWGAPDVTGKPVGSDLRARKKSMPVVAALTSGTEASAELAALLAGQEPLTEPQVAAGHLAGRAGWRPGPDRGHGGQGAGQRVRRPGPGRHARGRAGRIVRHRRVHHGAPVVAAPDLAGSADPAVSVATAARTALDRAVAHLLGLQDPAGWWKGELETNVTMDAEDLLLREFLGIRTAERDRQRRPAGSGPASAPTAPGRTSAAATPTCPPRSRRTWRCGWPATRPEAPHMAAAASWIRARGGVEATRVFTRIWLALFGVWPWDDLPVLPPELIYLPRWFPLNVYDWACWARQTIVPLTVVVLAPAGPAAAVRARRAARLRPDRRPSTGGALRDPWAAVFQGLDQALHRYERSLGRGKPAAALRAGGHAQGRRVDHRQAGARRLLGRHPAAVGVLAAGAAPAGLRARPSRHRARARRPRPVHDPRGRAGRPGATAGGLPVAGVGHRAGDGRPARRRRCPPTTRPWSGRRPTGCSTRRSAARATGRCAGQA